MLATAPRGAQSALSRMVEDNLANVQRMFARLRQLGVLDAWDAAPAATVHAAE